MASVTEFPREPEQYQVQPTPYCPNSALPVLVYRAVLPVPFDESSASEFLQRYGWEKRGTWGVITTKHFHPNTHECYGIFQGSSELIFGEGGSDISGSGVRCLVHAGDVVVVPAGVAHASVVDDIEGEEKYRYIGVYPEESPRWRSELGKRPLQTDDKLMQEVSAVGVPRYDPVVGPGGPLVRIWTQRRESTVVN